MSMKRRSDEYWISTLYLAAGADNMGLLICCIYLLKEGPLALLLGEGQFLCSVIFWSAVYVRVLPHTLHINWNLKNWNIWTYVQERLKSSAGLKKMWACLEEINFLSCKYLSLLTCTMDKSPGKPSTNKFLVMINFVNKE